ncbi:hypothetical protein ScPMuIL_014932 [Solemya velum]
MADKDSIPSVTPAEKEELTKKGAKGPGVSTESEEDPGAAGEQNEDEDVPKSSEAGEDPAVSTKNGNEWLKDYFSRALGISNKPKPEQLLEEISLEAIAKYINSGKCHNIITMAGAGISTSAGIPDFRSPGTGLYDNLQKYDLPHPQAVFDIGYFNEHPEPFFELSRELWPGKFEPTPCHYFIKMLNDKKKLLRHYTQNIDTLEHVAGLDPEKMVEAHGTFRTSHCLQCKHEYSQEWIKEKIFAKEVPKCAEEECEGTVKPDIVFFGEALPSRFFECVNKDFQECDLLIIMGTSLAVQPFASLTNKVPDTTPRLYINLEKNSGGDAFTMLLFGGGLEFDREDNYRDVYHQSTCDDGCYALADLLGWGADLRSLVKQEQDKLKRGAAGTTNKGKSTPSKTSPKSTPLKTFSPKGTPSKISPKSTPSKTYHKSTPSKTFSPKSTPSKTTSPKTPPLKSTPTKTSSKSPEQSSLPSPPPENISITSVPKNTATSSPKKTDQSPQKTNKR